MNYVGRKIIVYPLDGSEPFEDEITQEYYNSHIVSGHGIEFLYSGNEAIPYRRGKGYSRPQKYRFEFPKPLEVKDKGYVIGRGHYILIDNNNKYYIDTKSLLHLRFKNENNDCYNYKNGISIFKIEGTMTLMIHPEISNRLALFISEKDAEQINIGDVINLQSNL